MRDAILKRCPPSCPWGYTREDLARYFNAIEGKPHPLWIQLNGQTATICNGELYDHDTKEHYPSPCAENPHGLVSYTDDVLEWAAGQPVSDW